MLPAAGIAPARASRASASDVLPDPAWPTSARVLIRLMGNLDMARPPDVLATQPPANLHPDQLLQQPVYPLGHLQLREMADAWNDFDARMRHIAAHDIKPGRGLARLERDATALGVQAGALDRQQGDLYGGEGAFHVRCVPSPHARQKGGADRFGQPHRALDDRTAQFA